MNELLLQMLQQKYGLFTPCRLTGGYTNETYALEGTEPPLVVKLSSLDHQDALQELRSLQLLADSGLTPQVHDVFKTEDRRVAVMDHRQGENVQALLDRGELEKVTRLYRLMGECLARHIHSRRYQPAEPQGLHVAGLSADIEKMKGLGFVPMPLREESVRLLSRLADDQADWVLTHGDFGPHNVLAALDHSLTVLDWEWAAWAHPAHDVAWAMWFTRLHYPQHADELCASLQEGYTSVHAVHWSSDQLRAYAVWKVGMVLQRVQHAPEHVQAEWVRRLAWTLSF